MDKKEDSMKWFDDFFEKFNEENKKVEVNGERPFSKKVEILSDEDIPKRCFWNCWGEPEIDDSDIYD